MRPTTQIILINVLEAKLDEPQACDVPPKEEAPNLEKLLLDPETQPGEARDGVEKVEAATTDYETMEGFLAPTCY